MGITERKFKTAKEMERAAESSLREGACLLVSNARLVRRLVHLHRLGSMGNGAVAWESPKVYSMRFFVDKNYEELWREQRQLSYETSLLLWMDVLDKRNLAGGLPAGAELAAEFQRTYDLLEKYKVGAYICDDEFFSSRNEIFAEFKKEKKRKKLITYSEAVTKVRDASDSGEIGIPAEIVVIGEERLVPIERDLLESISQLNSVTSFVLEGERKVLRAELFNKPDDEIEVIAGRIVSGWGKGEGSTGILYFEESYKEKLERVFSDLERRETPAAGTTRCDIGESISLKDTPHYQIIEMIMSLREGLLDENLLSLISSPLCKKACLLDMNVWAGLASEIRRDNARGLKEFKRQFGFREEIDDFIEPREYKAADWTGKIEKLLVSFKFEADEKDGSSQRIIEKIGDCFRFIRLEREGDTVSLGRFKAIWECAASNAEMKSGGNGQAGIQVIPYKEGYGLCFDDLYILGCHQGVLPEKPGRYPLLHHKEKEQIQALSVPESYSSSEKLFNAILSGGASVNISRAVSDKETPLLASPFAVDGDKPGDWNIYTAGSPGLLRARWLAEALAVSARAAEKERGSRTARTPKAVELPEKISVTSLTQLFACPFKFFVGNFCGIEEGDEISALPDALESGGFLHELLEKCFEALRSFEKSRGVEALKDRLRTVAAEVIRSSDHTGTEKDSLLQFFNGREGKPGLIDKWAQFEAGRIEEGWAYKAAETRLYGIKLDDFGFFLNGKADRIDWNDNRKEMMIVDYKTGSSVRDDHKLQIALYKKMAAVKKDEEFSAPEDTAAISGGVLALGADKLKLEDCGREQEELYFERIRSSVENIRDARVEADPFPRPPSNGCPCTYCPYGDLCHIKEKNSGEEGTDG